MNKEKRDKYEELIENLEDEFDRVDYPVRNPMEVAPHLSNGPQTTFEGQEFEFKASKFATKLRKNLSDGPNNGFPYDNTQDMVEDTIYSLQEEDMLE